uniref:Uncharacterized protein n=1 Tax=Rhizophora mucronata TaxID=61149 RepID=A0A2P2N4R1_RHIMU
MWFQNNQRIRNRIASVIYALFVRKC